MIILILPEIFECRQNLSTERIFNNMKLGMVGLPNVGKSTLFNALTNAGAESANYPFCTIDKNIGIVSVPDERLDALAKMYNPEKFTPATLEFVDIAGLVKGASKGEGLGNKFLADIREVDAIVHVVRCFESMDIIHVDGEINPARDIETISLELIFSDIEMVDRRIDKAKKMVKGDKKYQAEIDFFSALKEHLEAGKPARSYPATDDELEMLKTSPLLSAKPVIYAANLSEDDFVNNIETKVYKTFLITTLIGIFLDVFGFILYVNGCDPNSLLYNCVAKGVLFYFIAWSFEFSYYIYAISCKEDKKKLIHLISHQIFFY